LIFYSDTYLKFSKFRKIKQNFIYFLVLISAFIVVLLIFYFLS